MPRSKPFQRPSLDFVYAEAITCARADAPEAAIREAAPGVDPNVVYSELGKSATAAWIILGGLAKCDLTQEDVLVFLGGYFAGIRDAASMAVAEEMTRGQE